MRLVLVVLFSCVVGTVIGFTTVEIENRRKVWYPERETVSVQNVKKSKIPTNPDAKAEIPETEHNFGVLNRDQQGQHDFLVKNVGSANLVLEVESKSCTCTDVKIANKTVRPGESTAITVFWNAEKSTSTFSQSALILTNDPENREVVLAVKGLYTATVIPSPGSLQFSSIAINRGASGSFRVFGLGKTPLEITKIDFSDQEHFEVSVSPDQLTEEDGKSPIYKNANNVLKVEITVKPGLPTGSFQERLILHTNYESDPSVEYFVRGMVQAGNIVVGGKDFVRDTGSIRMGKTVVGKPLATTISIRYTGPVPPEAELKVAKIEPEVLKVEIQKLGTGNTIYNVNLEVLSSTPGYWNGPEIRKMGSVVFETGLPDSPTLSIPVQFMIEKL